MDIGLSLENMYHKKMYHLFNVIHRPPYNRMKMMDDDELTRIAIVIFFSTTIIIQMTTRNNTLP